MKSPIHNPIPWARSRVGGPIAILVLASLLIAVTANAAVRYQVLKSFTGADGRDSRGGLREASDGWLYGTTLFGGTNDLGTLFRINKDGGGHTVLHRFGSADGDGVRPACQLLEGSDGLLYGTTGGGGTNNMGTVFRLNKDGTGYAILSHGQTNGFPTPEYSTFGPTGDLIEARDGGLCGLGSVGLFYLGRNGGGIGWNDFTRYAGPPVGEPVEAPDGAFYVTTRATGGLGDCSDVLGAVLKVHAGSFVPKFLWRFSPCERNGQQPPDGLVRGSDGILYGVTAEGGGFGKSGTAFALREDGSSLQVLHRFPSFATDGQRPRAALTVGMGGILYGTTYQGGAHGAGVVFALSTDGSTYHVLHSFATNGMDGQRPWARLVQATDGALYGTTSQGGAFGFGTVFKLWPPPRMLPPVVSNGAVSLRMLDGPGLTNEVQRATALNGTWLTLTNLVVPDSGVAECTDPAPPKPSAFYRVVAH